MMIKPYDEYGNSYDREMLDLREKLIEAEAHISGAKTYTLDEVTSRLDEIIG